METSMKKQSGFTLIELLIVIALIGILSAIGIPAYTGYQAKARYNAAKTNHTNAVSYITAEIAKCNGKTTPISFVDKNGKTISISECPITTQIGSADLYFNTYIFNTFTNPYFPLNRTNSVNPSAAVGGLTWGYMTIYNGIDSGIGQNGIKLTTGIGRADGDKTKAGEILLTFISSDD